MCGIAGFTHGCRAACPGQIQGAVPTLTHRGPNQQGVFESEAVSLGATRLKIIDMEGGDQPIVSADGDTVIVFNGEIYNHLEIRSELEQRGHSLRSKSDTETVLNAFLGWGAECFARLRGMFAVGLWRESERRLVLARDRMGIKPLYIARVGEELYFGSELKAILVHDEIERCLSLDGLDCYLSLNYVPAPWTLVEGIEKLLPGQWLEWNRGAIRTEHYWRLPDVPSDMRWTAEAAEAELNRLLQASVREHMASDVPLGVWLSGGIDSSSLVHYASQATSARLKTFSISFRGRSFDETSYARRVAQHYGTEHTESDARQAGCLGVESSETGFDVPTHHWFRGTLRPVLEEAVRFAWAEHGEFFRIEQIEAHMGDHMEGRANLGYHLWGLMTLFFWMKKWGIQTRAGRAPRRTMERVFIST